MEILAETPACSDYLTKIGTSLYVIVPELVKRPI